MPEVVISVRTVYDGSGMEAAEADMQRAQAVSQEVQQQAASAVASTTSAVAPAAMPAAATALPPSVVAVADREGPVSGSLAEMHTYFEGLQREHAQQMADLQTAGMEIANENLDKFYAMQEAAGAMARNPTPMEEGTGAMDELGEAAEGAAGGIAAAGHAGEGFFSGGNPWVKLMIGGAIARGFWGAGKAAVAFSDAMNYVGTELGGNAKEIKYFHDQLMDLAPKLGRTLPELSAGLYQTLAEGVAPDKALRFLKMSSNLATAGNAPLDQVVGVLGGAMHSYHLNFAQTAHFADEIAKAVHHSKMQIGELGGDLSVLTSITGPLHMGLQEDMTALMTLVNAGVPASTAMQGLREFFLDLVKEQKNFKKAGVDIVHDMQHGGLMKVIGDLQRVTKGGNISLTEKFVPNIRAITPALDMLGKHVKDLALNYDELAHSEGEAGKQANEMLSNIGGAAKKAAGAWSAFKTAFGEALPTGPALKGAQHFGEGGTRFFQALGHVETIVKNATIEADKWIEAINPPHPENRPHGGHFFDQQPHASVTALHQKISALPTHKVLHLDTSAAQAKVSALQEQINKLGYSLENGIATNIARGSSPIPAALAQAGAQ